MTRKKKANSDPFRMLRTRLRDQRAKMSNSMREDNSRTGEWLRIFYKSILARRNSIRQQHFLPGRDCQLLVSIVDNISDAPETLESMAGDKHADVRTAVADNANTPVETLMILAQDENADVRYSLAENNNLPAGVLEVLSEDENPYVAVRAKNTLDNRSKGKSALTAPFQGIFQNTRPGWAM